MFASQSWSHEHVPMRFVRCTSATQRISRLKTDRSIASVSLKPQIRAASPSRSVAPKPVGVVTGAHPRAIASDKAHPRILHTAWKEKDLRLD